MMKNTNDHYHPYREVADIADTFCDNLNLLNITLYTAGTMALLALIKWESSPFTHGITMILQQSWPSMIIFGLIGLLCFYMFLRCISPSSEKLQLKFTKFGASLANKAAQYLGIVIGYSLFVIFGSINSNTAIDSLLIGWYSILIIVCGISAIFSSNWFLACIRNRWYFGTLSLLFSVACFGKILLPNT